MSKDSPKTLEPDEVTKTVRCHTWAAFVPVALLAAVLLILVICDLKDPWGDGAPADLVGVPGDAVPPDLEGAPANAEVSRSLLVGGLLLAVAYVGVLLLRYVPFMTKKQTPTRARPGKRKELYEALTPERYIIAGSAVTILFVVAVLCGLPVLEQATTLLAGIAFVTPLGVVLNKWGDLGEYYHRDKPKTPPS